MGPLEVCTLPGGGLRTAEEIQAGPIDKMVEAQVIWSIFTTGLSPMYEGPEL
jgi:hypothetical protein